MSEYACQVFHNGLPGYLSDELEKIQRRALRMFFIPWPPVNFHINRGDFLLKIRGGPWTPIHVFVYVLKKPMQKTREKKKMDYTRHVQAIEERPQMKKKINDSKSALIRGKYRTGCTENNNIRTVKMGNMERLAKEAVPTRHSQETESMVSWYLKVKLVSSCKKTRSNSVMQTIISMEPPWVRKWL